MHITEQEIIEMKNFILQLNSTKDSVIVVEGKKDSSALKKIGCSSKILEFHKFGGMINFTDSIAEYKKIIILFDKDRKGKQLTKKTIELLQRRTRIDLSYKSNLHTITKGKIRFIEQLVCYEPFLA